VIHSPRVAAKPRIQFAAIVSGESLRTYRIFGELIASTTSHVSDEEALSATITSKLS